MHILGVNAYHGDSSAALLSEGQLVTAIEEERLNRIKHWAGLPVQAIQSCLEGVDVRDVGHVAISRDPKAHLGRKLLRVLTQPFLWKQAQSRVANSVEVGRFGDRLREAGLAFAPGTQFHCVEHHRAHLASAFFVSPFEEAAVVSVDGFGDFSSVMWGVGRDNQFDVRGSVRFPHSLGVFYSAFTQFLGFPKYGDEYKMMGLSAFGNPQRFLSKVREVVQTKDGQVRLDLDYFIHHNHGWAMTWESGEPVMGRVFSQKMTEVFGTPRAARSELTERDRDLAAAVQAVLEENYFSLLNYVAKQTRQSTVCLAGGVALNCAANGYIFERTPFRDVYIQPAAHDAGTSFGAALYVQHQMLKQPRNFVMRHACFGPSHDESAILSDLQAVGCTFRRYEEDELVRRTAEAIAAGKIVGWFQGRMEFGPRALGGRSILADPRSSEMKEVLNLRIKYREPFRPFCPSILAEETGNWFETDYPSPFMVQAYKIKPARRSQVPAVTHNDGTGRLQTVDREVSPLYWKLINQFRRITGVPILINTSFNENEPIVHLPAQAIDCFLRTQMDVLAIGPYLLDKADNLHLSEKKRVFAEV
jgi:carbamoyltransferase